MPPLNLIDVVVPDVLSVLFVKLESGPEIDHDEDDMVSVERRSDHSKE